MSARKPTDIEKIEALRTALRHIQTLALGMEHGQDCAYVTSSADSRCDCGRNAILQTAGKALGLLVAVGLVLGVWPRLRVTS